MIYNKSIKAFKESRGLIPGGVNSPVRAFKSVNCDPVFFDYGNGSKLYDLDGNEYIDCISSWGPLIFGHADKITQSKISEYLRKGTTYGAPTIIESEMAKKIIELVPSIEKVRMVNSGTEATMSAIRLARGYTSRNLILKFSGNYHGHGDSFLIKAGSGAMTLGLPDSPGVTKNTAKDTIIADFNSFESVSEQFKKTNLFLNNMLFDENKSHYSYYVGKNYNDDKDMFSFSPSKLIKDQIIECHERVILDVKQFGLQKLGAGSVCTRLFLEKSNNNNLDDNFLYDYWEKLAKTCFDQGFVLGFNFELPKII